MRTFLRAVLLGLLLPSLAFAQQIGVGPIIPGSGGSGGGSGGGGNMTGSGATTGGNLLQSGNTGAVLNSATDTGVPLSSVVTTSGAQTLAGPKTLASPVFTGAIAGSPSASGTWSFGSVQISPNLVTGLVNPVNPSDAANKAYVDALAGTSTTWHTSVTVATAAVLPNTPSYSNGSSGVGATLTSGSNIALVVDGVTVSTTTTRVLVQNQASAFQNGIYTLTQAGTGSVPWILTRATDFNTVGAGGVATGAAVLATSGTANTGLQFWMNQTAAITIGTTAITWVQIGGAGLVGGTGITISGNAINLNSTLPSALTIPSPAITTPTIGGFTFALGGNTTLPAAPGSTSCLHMSATGAITNASGDCLISAGLGTGLTNALGTQNTGSLSLAAATPNIYPQNWVTAYTTNHTVSLSDGVQTYVANGSGAVTFTIGSASNDGAAGVGYCFVDESGHGFTLTIAEPASGTFYGAGSGSSFTAGPGKSAYACTTSDGTNVALGVAYPSASSAAGATGNPQYNAGGGFGGTPTIINALAMTGADVCAQISAAAQALPASGGIVDDRGSNGTQTACAGSMFDSWPNCQTIGTASGCSIKVLLGPATYIQNYSWQTPPHTSVEGIGDLGSGGPKTYLQIGNSFLTAIPSAPALSCSSGTSSYFKIAYGNTHDESLPSSEKTCNATTSITVTAPSSGTCASANATVYYVYASTSSGAETLQNAGGTACGTNYTAATITTSGHTVALAMPVVALGPTPYAASNASTAYYGIRVSRVVADCIDPGSTRETNLTGFLNANAEQGSAWEHVGAWACETAFDVETAGAQNAGPYTDMGQLDSAALDAASVCMKLGTDAAGATLNSVFQMISCGSNVSTPQTVSIYLDCQDCKIANLDMEDAVNAIVAGTNHNVGGSKAELVTCGGGVTTSCVKLISGDTPGFVATSIANPGGATDTLLEGGSGTGCGTVTGPTVSLYIHGAGGTGQTSGCISY